MATTYFSFKLNKKNWLSMFYLIILYKYNLTVVQWTLYTNTVHINNLKNSRQLSLSELVMPVTN